MVPPPQQLGLQLQGLWSIVTSSGNTPSTEVTLTGDSVVALDEMANIRELSAYHNVNRIHEHLQAWLPDFDGMDFQMPTIVDVSGTCNAFYTPGSPHDQFLFRRRWVQCIFTRERCRLSRIRTWHQ